MRLDEVCDIQSGYTARERLVDNPFGVPALQLRDLNDADDWQQVEPGTYALGDIHERYFAGPGDLLFRSRGLINTASAIPPDWPYLAAVMLPLLLLKPDTRLVRPDYLAWSINRSDTQREIASKARGTSLRMVPRPALAELQLDVPDLAMQDAILEASRLADHAEALEKQAAELRHALSGLLLREAAQKAATRSHHGATA